MRVRLLTAILSCLLTAGLFAGTQAASAYRAPITDEVEQPPQFSPDPEARHEPEPEQ